MTKINGEPVELVRDFRELRAGMIIYDIGCINCGRSACRGMLVTLHETGLPGEVDILDGYAWELTPDCIPDRRPGHFPGVGPEAVEERRIYRVITGAEDETVSAGRALERTR